MKKIYEKPLIMFESFTLSTNIATDCEKKTDTKSNGNSDCGYYFTGLGNLFIDSIGACKDSSWVTGWGSDDGYFGSENDAICYHVPFGENLFNS